MLYIGILGFVIALIALVFMECGIQSKIETIETPDKYEQVKGWVTPFKEYGDRDFMITTVEGVPDSAVYLRTLNNDKTDTLGFKIVIDEAALLYVAYDSNRAVNLPRWLESWDNSAAGIYTSDLAANPLELFYKFVEDDTISIGGNRAYPAQDNPSMFVMFIYEIQIPRTDVYKGHTCRILCNPNVEDDFNGYRLWIDKQPITSFGLNQIAYTVYYDQTMAQMEYTVISDSGNYKWNLTAYDFVGNESGLSNTVYIHVVDDKTAPEDPVDVIVIN